MSHRPANVVTSGRCASTTVISLISTSSITGQGRLTRGLDQASEMLLPHGHYPVKERSCSCFMQRIGCSKSHHETMQNSEYAVRNRRHGVKMSTIGDQVFHCQHIVEHCGFHEASKDRTLENPHMLKVKTLTRHCPV